MIPIENSGIVNGAINSDLGTLRVYSSTPSGRPEHLLWAETYTGLADLPWPAVVRRLISQFQKHFQIKLEVAHSDTRESPEAKLLGFGAFCSVSLYGRAKD